MNKRSEKIVFGIVKFTAILLLTFFISVAVTSRMMGIAGVWDFKTSWWNITDRLSAVEQSLSDISVSGSDKTEVIVQQQINNPLKGKKIIYDGDSIAESRENNGGGYAALIAELSESTFVNFAKGGARLCSHSENHSVVDNLVNLPDDGDLYCFEGGINDFWMNTPIGECDPLDFTGELDTNTICGAMETIFRYCMEKFPGKPVCFVITHKVQKTAVSKNANGDTFEDFHNAMVTVCKKYSIPYYDAFNESGLNGWNNTQNNLFLTANSSAEPDGTHPNMEGYKRYYVPQLLDLFEKIIPYQ